MSTASPGHRGPRSRVAPHGHWLTLAAAASALAVIAGQVRPADAPSSELVALVRVAMTTVLAATLILGPGLVLRGRRGWPLGYVPLPGIGLLCGIGLVTWLTAPTVDPHVTSSAGLVTVLLGTVIANQRDPVIVVAEEARVLIVAAVVYVVALGRSLWSLGPAGDLFTGTVSRTLESGDRPDSRISYHVTSLVTHGLSPSSDQGAALFFPYTFADRGPVPGFGSAPVMLASGATPSLAFPDQAWSLFDPQGFMAYRIVMMMLALTALLAVYTLTRTAAGPRLAWLAVLVVAGTPFVVHEVYFTWPKLAAAAMCLLAADLVLRHRMLAAGVFIGFGFLMHPLALVAAPTVLVLVLLVAVDEARRSRRPVVPILRRLATGGTACVVGVLAVVGAWRLANLSQPSPSNFTDYVFAADGQLQVGPATWVDSRITSILNTLVPFHLPALDADNRSVNAGPGAESEVTVFFFQYWNGLPFGTALVFLPALLVGLWIVARRRPWLVLGVLVLPFAVFAVYWGSSESGLLREGMHPWVLSVLVVWVLHLATPDGGPAAVPTWMRILLVLRPVEVVVMISVPTVQASGRLLGPGRSLGDVSALVLMAFGVVALMLLTWQGTAERSRDGALMPR